MDHHKELAKDILMRLVTQSTLRNVQDWFNYNDCKLIKDKTYFDYELLKAALQRNHISIIKFLLNQGCRVRNPGKVNLEEPALHLAMKLNNYEILRKVLKKGASISDKNLNGETALYAAFKEECKNAVNIALTHISNYEHKCLNPKDKDNIIHFHIACVTNHVSAVKLYLNHGLNVNSPICLNSPEFSGLNPLHYAASKAYRSVFESLVEHGGDLTIKNSTGQTPLQIIHYKKGITTISMIEAAFKKGNDTKFINSVDNNGVSHFHLCCAIDYPNFVEVFIKNGVDINSSTSVSCSKFPGFTPLHFAVKYNCKKVVQLLLENGVDCNKVDKEGSTPLHVACGKESYQLESQIEIIEMLLDYDGSPAVVDQNGCTPLHKAFCTIPNWRKNILDKLISKIPREINFTDNQGLSHFHIVCARNDVSRANEFLTSGVAVDSCVLLGENSGYTALHFAVLYNQKDVVKVLLEQNAKVNIQSNKFQVTPLHLACSYILHRIKLHEIWPSSGSSNANYLSNHKRHLDIIDLLLLYEAEIDARDSSGTTPLIYACTVDKNNIYDDSLTIEINERTKNIIKILLSNKANINARNNRQESILHLISSWSFSNMQDLLEYLIIEGADVHAVDHNGLTPLHVAVKSSKKELVQIFLKYKANINAKFEDSLSPLQLALENGYNQYSSPCDKDILCALLESDSDNAQDGKYRTLLLQKAIKQFKIFVTEKLLYYGADINMEDSFGNSTVSSLLEWDSIPIEYSWTNVLYAEMFETIFIHVQKLLALNCHVNEKVKTVCIQLSQRYEHWLSKTNGVKKLDIIFNNCVEELSRMKLIKIDNYTSLYNILYKDTHELSKHVKNNTLVKIMEDQSIDNNFPLYNYLLKIQFKKGLKRSDVLSFAKSSLTYVIGLNLPDLCYDLVLKYLTNEEITNLKASAKSSCKRKLKDDDSNNTESSTKLQRK